MTAEKDSTTAGRWDQAEMAQRSRGHPVIRRVLALCGAALVFASFYYLGARLSPWLCGHDWHGLQPRWGWLAAALGAFTLCPILRGLMWWYLLSALGMEATPKQCLIVQMRANLIKYIPGGVWELAGKAYLSGRTGRERLTSGVAAAIDLGYMLVTGLLVTLALMPSESGAIPVHAMARWPALAVLAAGLYATPWALKWIGAHAPAQWLPQGAAVVAPHRLHFGVLAMLAHWLLAGLGLALLLEAFGVGRPPSAWYAVYALAVSATAGLLVVVAPAGVGVREAVLARMLGQWMPMGPASFVAVLSRLGLVAGELTAFAAVALIARSTRSRGSA